MRNNIYWKQKITCSIYTTWNIYDFGISWLWTLHRLLWCMDVINLSSKTAWQNHRQIIIDGQLWNIPVINHVPMIAKMIANQNV